MRLKSLRLAGFKSFANPTTFHFKKNITAIVGPNGCGKSNVIDAIRWVLGESSAKQLRGGAMSDVIFAGTQEKTAKSLASVELTFEHTQDEQTGIRHELNLYHELSVRRQINKNGKSDYFINGTRCRRRDVVDIFLGTGLGSRSYAVIEQGMIGRIVDSNPLQLREFIEEGAGVSRYQARRIETQKQLTQAQDNLSRLNDLKSELEKQHTTLSRQAETAKKYQQLTEELQTLEQDIAIHQLYVCKLDEQKQQSTHQTLTQEVAEIQKQVTAQNAKVEKLNERIAEQQWLKDEAQDKRHQEQLALQQAEHALSQHQGKIQQQIDKQNTLIEQEKDNQAQLTEIEEKYTLEKQQLEFLTPQKTTLQQQQQETQQQLTPLNRQWQQIHAKREQTQKQQQQLEKQQALSEQAKKHLANEQQKNVQKLGQWQQAWENLSQNATIDSLETQLKEEKQQLTRLQNQSEDINDNLEEQQDKFQRLKEQINEKQSQLQGLEKQHASLMSEYNTLHSLVYAKPKKAINSQNSQQTDSFNINQLKQLTDNIELTELGKKHADKLDKWLALWLDTFTTENIDFTDKNWLNLLQQNQPTASNRAILTKVKFAEKCPQLADNFIAFNQLIKSPQISIWQNAYLLVVENSQTDLEKIQQQLQNLPTSYFVLTTTGWIIAQSGMIHLSKLVKNNPDSHFLQQREQQRQRLEELEESLTPLEDTIEDEQKTLKSHQRNHDDLQIQVQELTSQVRNLQQQIHEKQQTISQLTNQCERYSADKLRLDNEKNQLDNDKISLEKQQIALNSQGVEVSEQLSELTKKLAEIEDEREQIRQKRNDSEQQHRNIEQQLQAITLNHSQLNISLQHVEKQKNQLNKFLARSQQEQQQATDSIEKLTAELPKLEQVVKQQQNLCHESQISLDEYQGQLSELHAQQSAERVILNQLQMQFATQQQKLADISTKFAIAKEHLNEASNRVNELANNEKYSLTAKSGQLLNQFLANIANFQREKQQNLQNQRQEDYQKLQIKIARIGAVNLMAMEELEQINERLAPLSEQTEDILASIDKLTDAIATIDNKTKELFLQTLEAVNKDLLHLFSKVFGGGQASLTLIDDEKLAKKDQWRAGLELMAQPKGKKNARLAVLSGGEKTLTALSLIFAIFKQHPAPFCLLDEVDAPLDDANVKRFTGLIEELANDLQFIFISHNKLSMQIADELKGITMPQAGISSLVSVSLDEAEGFIDE